MVDSQKSYRIPKDNISAIFAEAMLLANYIYVDELDCAKSFARQQTDKTIEEVFEIALNNKSTLWNFIYRPHLFNGENPYFDIGCSTIGLKPDYFLWIRLSVENGEKLIKKYKLELRS